MLKDANKSLQKKILISILIGVVISITLVLCADFYRYTAFVGVSPAHTDLVTDLVNGLITQGIFFSLILMCFGACVFFFVKRHMIEPLHRLLGEMKRFEPTDEGSLPLFCDQYDDEFLWFTTAFNGVSKKLSKRAYEVSELRQRMQKITEEVPVLLAYLDENRRYS